MSFRRVSRLPFASPQMLLSSFDSTPCLAKPVRVIPEGFETAVCQPSNGNDMHGLCKARLRCRSEVEAAEKPLRAGKRQSRNPKE